MKFWLLAVAISIAAASPVEAQQGQPPTDDSEVAETEAPKADVDPVTDAQILPDVPAPEGAPEQPEQEPTEEDEPTSFFSFLTDLRAQWTMAFTGIVAALSSVGAVVGLIFTLRRQHRQFAAERRPWVQFADAKLVGPISYAPGEGFSARIAITVKNVGNSPALNLRVEAKFLATVWADVVLRDLEALRHEVKSRSTVAESALFPNSTFNRELPLMVSEAEINEELERRRAHNPELTGANKEFFAPFLFGVVAYRSSYSTDIHTTTFVLAGLEDMKALGIEKGKRAKFENVELVQLLAGWTAD